MSAKLILIGKPISTADMTTIPAVFQRFNLPATFQHQLLQGVGLGLVLYAANYAALSVEIWSDLAGTPSQLLATSTTTWTKAQVDASFPKVYKFISAGFQFTPFPLRRGVHYHIALRATNYTGDSTSHIAWRNAYPRVQYASALGFTIEAIKAAVVPREAVLFTSEF